MTYSERIVTSSMSTSPSRSTSAALRCVGVPARTPWAICRHSLTSSMSIVPSPLVSPRVTAITVVATTLYAIASVFLKRIHPTFSPHAWPVKLPLIGSIPTPPWVGLKLIQPTLVPQA